ncbi:MAG TPA: hypothetical protein VGR96_10020 [Acidobacteriaceae bacterium]|nr:hypothetical protein [Acidobacteriaceae bacterium]
MLYMYALILVVFASLLYTAYQILKGSRRKPECVVPLLPPISQPLDLINSLRAINCGLKWISLKEFDTLLERSKDVIFIDLRGSAEEPLPFSISRVLCITPSELAGALQWLPSGSIIVLYGKTPLCTSIAKGVQSFSHFKPVYILKDDSGHTEAA